VPALFRLAFAVPFVVFLGVCGLSVGNGFVSDDFGWILQSRVSSFREIPSLFLQSSGFYRPIVGLTFATDYAIFGNHPLGYGLTNLALALVCAALLFLVARELSLPWGAAIFAAALWLLNPHGMNTAILWMSGRTSLMLTMGALGAAWLVLRGRPFIALAPAAVALFAKEEAFLLPAILFGWWFAFRPDDAALSRRRVGLWPVAAAALLGVYLALRSQTGAMTPWTAPPYYRFTARPSVIARNIALDEAFELASGRRLHFWIEPPLQNAALAGLVPPCPTCAQLMVTIRAGHVVH
jgi:hypothetical protein